ncbi:outer membrane protein assembly factor BamC [Plasticicumulans acidivorans]|uniref:Beta-barrel assembly machine subunit BamC n=1 Tax=Plasticicumulans acidivorans TaxID=886464 RepID=A0A317MPU3_9GAMM|nr:outer membrane protein assembly factor BamC [Plasticicumulans acidivorans]PWV58521.1 Beta-barrel assembly machine subunit BamC [Plasticicumulans acidivorans]
MSSSSTVLRLAITGSALLVVACSSPVDSIIPDRRIDYRQAQSAAPLELPPDLTSSTVDDTLKVPELTPSAQASLSDYNNERGVTGHAGQAAAASATPRLMNTESVLIQPDGMRVMRDGEKRWLSIKAAPDQVWSKVREFWTSNGFLLKRDDPRIGIMETDWAENRADIPLDPVRSLLSKALDFAYSAPTRDKFRIRLERDGDRTDVFITQYGVKEVGRGRDNETTVWEPRPNDPELEAEMLSRLMVYLGASEDRARAETGAGSKAAAAPVLTRPFDQEGVRGLVIAQDYGRAWRSVGAALDGSNYVVEEQDRASGQYTVEYVDRAAENAAADANKGWFSGWFGSKSAPQASGTRYKVRLADRGNETVVVVQDAQGQYDNAAQARDLLETIARGVR